MGNTVDDQVAPLSLPETIKGLTYDGTNLWVLHESRLRKLEWPSGTEVAVHELGAFSVYDLSGLEVVDDLSAELSELAFPGGKLFGFVDAEAPVFAGGGGDGDWSDGHGGSLHRTAPRGHWSGSPGRAAAASQ